MGTESMGFEKNVLRTPQSVCVFEVFDNWIRRQSFESQVVGLRYFNVYGPQENHKGRMASTVRHFTQINEKEVLNSLKAVTSFVVTCTCR